MKFCKNLTFEKCVVRLLISYGLVATFFLVSNPQKYTNISFFNNVSFTALVFAMVIGFILLSLIFNMSKSMKTEKFMFFLVIAIFFAATLLISADIYYFIGVCLIMGLVIYYCFKETEINSFLKDSDMGVKVNHNFVKLSYLMLALVFIVFVGGLTSLRYFAYKAPGFDFGIFTQMFHNMKTTFLPNTTVELDKLSSHFQVHVSPIYYLILPFYYIFPHPITLQISQAVILASGLIPLYMLCKQFKLSSYVTFAIGVCYTFYPALSSGCFYDIHENAFLTPLILWLLYFIEKEKLRGMLAFSVLLFLVKEDAPVYVAFIGLYILIGKKQFKNGSIVFVLSVLYFVFVIWLLKHFGEGAKFDRYDNYNYDGSGIIAVIKAVFINPAYVLSQCMTQEKLLYVLKMLVPLAFLPLINKDFSKYILVGPFILVNLMSNYPYQHSIDFQYNFGVIAIFFYLLISNIVDFKMQHRKMISLFCATSAVILFSFTTMSKIDIINEFKNNNERINSMNECVSMIPQSASVGASCYFVAHLYSHETLYELPTRNQTEYIIFDLKVKTNGANLSDYENDNYEELYFDEGIVALYRRK